MIEKCILDVFYHLEKKDGYQNTVFPSEIDKYIHIRHLQIILNTLDKCPNLERYVGGWRIRK